MNYTLAVFKSRYATLTYANLLKASNIPVAIINTPNTISKVCGISVKFLSDYNSMAQALLKKMNISTFVGFYSLKSNRG